MYSVTYQNLLKRAFSVLNDKNIDNKIIASCYLEVLYERNIIDKPSNLLRKLLFIDKVLFNNEIEYHNAYYRYCNNRFVQENRGFLNKMIPEINYVNEKINFVNNSKSSLLAILSSFLQYISPNLLAFYHDLVKNKQIYMVLKSRNNNQAFTLQDVFDTSKQYIFLYQFDNIKNVSTLIHELGHCYYNYLNGINCYKNTDVKESIKQEIPSIMLESLFIDYLRMNHYYKRADMLEKDYFNAMYYYRKNMYNVNNIRYLIGFFGGNELKKDINYKYSLEEMMIYINNTDYHD